MKIPKKPSLNDIQEPSAFTRAVTSENGDSGKMSVVSHTLGDRQKAQILAVAVELTQRKGKPVSASEALRHILDRFKEEGIAL